MVICYDNNRKLINVKIISSLTEIRELGEYEIATRLSCPSKTNLGHLPLLSQVAVDTCNSTGERLRPEDLGTHF